MSYISHRSYHPGAWSGGTTCAIWAEPAAALTSPAAARWWVGTAVIERDAPYSHFAGRHRLHLPIRGQGLRLRFRNPSEEVALASGTQHQFDGERPVEAALVDGFVVAFNLIYQVGVVATAGVAIVGPAGLVWPLRTPEDHSPGGTHEPVRVIYTISGALTADTNDGQQEALQSDDSVVIMPGAGAEAPLQVRLTADSRTGAEVVLATLWLPRGAVV
jgi:hypothetical protein